MIAHPGPSGSPSYLGPAGGHLAGPMSVGPAGIPPPGLTPPMDPGALTPDPIGMPPMPPPGALPPMAPNGPIMSMYSGMPPMHNQTPHMTAGPSPSSLSPHQMDGRLSGPPQPMGHPAIPPPFARRFPMPPADFKIYEMCRRLQQKPENCDNIWWDHFVSEFFEDDSTYTLNFFLEDGPKRYSFGRHLIPRFFRTMFESGVTQLSYNLRNPKQDGNAISIFLVCENTLMSTYHSKPSQAHVVTEGKLQVEFTCADLMSMKIKAWNFTIQMSHEYVNRHEIQNLRASSSSIQNLDQALSNLSKNITRSGLTNNILNYLRLCVILEPMQELMSRHKIYGASPRDCLKTTLFERYQRAMAGTQGPEPPVNPIPEPSPSRTQTKTRRKRKTSNASGGANAGNDSNSNNSSSNNSGGGSGSKKKNSANSPATPAFNPSNVDVLVVGEPSLMGGEFGDEDERKITRLENNTSSPNGSSSAAQTPTGTGPGPTTSAPGPGGGGAGAGTSTCQTSTNPSTPLNNSSSSPLQTRPGASTPSAPPPAPSSNAGIISSNPGIPTPEAPISNLNNGNATDSKLMVNGSYNPSSHIKSEPTGGIKQENIKQEAPDGPGPGLVPQSAGFQGGGSGGGNNSPSDSSNTALAPPPPNLAPPPATNGPTSSIQELEDKFSMNIPVTTASNNELSPKVNFPSSAADFLCDIKPGISNSKIPAGPLPTNGGPPPWGMGHALPPSLNAPAPATTGPDPNSTVASLPFQNSLPRL